MPERGSEPTFVRRTRKTETDHEKDRELFTQNMNELLFDLRLSLNRLDQNANRIGRTNQLIIEIQQAMEVAQATPTKQLLILQRKLAFRARKILWE